MIKPVIVAVGYNRPDSMSRLLTSIENAYYSFDDITLIVSIDECEKSDDVQCAAEKIKWSHGEKIIRRFPERQGLRAHVLSCGDYSLEYGAAIILEDDLIVSPSFYQYIYKAVNYYDDKRIAGYALYSHAWNGYAGLSFTPVHNEYDAYLGQFSITWGQCWTSTQWKNFRAWYKVNSDNLPDINSKMPESILNWSKQSWGKYFVSYIVEKDLYYLMPYTALSTNFTEIGQHNKHTDSTHQVVLQSGVKLDYSFPTFENAIKYDSFFERNYSDYSIAGVSGSDICVNLNSNRNDTLGKKYLLTTEKMDLPIIASFGLNVRPIDANIDLNMPGSDIFLYENDHSKLRKARMTTKRREYEFFGFGWRDVLAEGVNRFSMALLRKLKIKK